MAKEGEFNWFKNPEEQKKIEEKINTLEKRGEIGNDDELKENLRIHDLTTSGKKEGKELVEDEFTWEGKDIEEKAINISEKIIAEIEKLGFERSQNEKQEIKIFEKESRFYYKIQDLLGKMPEDKNLQAYKNMERIIDTMSGRFIQIQKVNTETIKKLSQREEEIKKMISFLNKKKKAIKELMEPAHPKMN